MNFYEQYHRFMRNLVISEASPLGGESLGGGDTQPTGKQEQPAGSDNNPQGPQPKPEQNQTPVDPFELTFANFVLALSRLKARDQNIVNFPLDQSELNLAKYGSNPNSVKTFLKAVIKRFSHMTGTGAAQLNYNDPKFGDKLGTSQQILGWANAIINILKNVKNPQGTTNSEIASFKEITSENLDKFKQTLESLNITK
jgi:hypothetical protein